MTNEMKLITALCDALGFDVETVCVNQDALDRDKEWHKEHLIKEAGLKWFQHHILDPYIPDLKPIYEYKLTKRVHIINGIEAEHGDLLDVSILDGKTVVEKRGLESEDADLAAIVRSRLDQPEIKVSLNDLGLPSGKVT
jgi:hypothetical protein